jgi:hypothetical protein
LGTAPRIVPRWITSAALNSPCSQTHRRADDDHRLEIGGGVDQELEAGQHALQQRTLMEEILAGVARQPELGEGHQRAARLIGAANELQRAPGVELRIADPHLGHRGGDPHEAVGVGRAERRIQVT